MSSGERPIGAAKGKQSDTEALCQPPPPPSRSDHHEKQTKFNIGKIWSDHFWYTNFWVTDPPSSPPPPPHSPGLHGVGDEAWASALSRLGTGNPFWGAGRSALLRVQAGRRTRPLHSSGE